MCVLATIQNYFFLIYKFFSYCRYVKNDKGSLTWETINVYNIFTDIAYNNIIASCLTYCNLEYSWTSFFNSSYFLREVRILKHLAENLLRFVGSIDIINVHGILDIIDDEWAWWIVKLRRFSGRKKVVEWCHCSRSNESVTDSFARSGNSFLRVVGKERMGDSINDHHYIERVILYSVRRIIK